MNHISLFSGIGGFDLAAEWMGWNNVAHCEWNPFCQRVLKYHFPKSIQHHDITKTDFSVYRGTTDIVTGGFPCQPYSVAGKQKGTADERHLWPEMLRAIREIQPTHVVGENVPGLVNWSNGLVFEQVQSDLEAQGYEVTPFLLPACGTNAPHKRERIWFIAYRYGAGLQKDRPEQQTARIGQHGELDAIIANAPNNRSKQQSRRRNDGKQWRLSERGKINEMGQFIGSSEIITDPNYSRLEILQCERGYNEKKCQAIERNNNGWKNWPTQSPVCNGNDGISSKLDGITFSKWRNESIKAGGNAIVPQVALQIFKAIKEFDLLQK